MIWAWFIVHANDPMVQVVALAFAISLVLAAGSLMEKRDTFPYPMPPGTPYLADKDEPAA